MKQYVPILSIRPSEVAALSELPDLSKDRMTPLILIKPWLGAGALSRAVDKIHHGFGNRAWYAELDLDYLPSHGSNNFEEIQKLRDPQGGFSNWIDYVESQSNAIPVLQIEGADPQTLILQLDNAVAVGRGACIRVPRDGVFPLELLVNVLANAGRSCDFILDYRQQDSRLLVNVIPANADITLLRRSLGKCKIAVSATTFPSNFPDTSQSIYERNFYDQICEVSGDNSIIYSDRGSARATEQRGGGVPRPRIDLPATADWHFFRSECVRELNESDEDYRERRVGAYQEMAEAAVQSDAWDDNLNIWGTQFIKLTQLGGQFGINSPAKATSCRINIHMARQSLFGIDLSSEEFEEEWVD